MNIIILGVRIIEDSDNRGSDNRGCTVLSVYVAGVLETTPIMSVYVCRSASNTPIISGVHITGMLQGGV